jgi:hypothetical protein
MARCDPDGVRGMSTKYTHTLSTMSEQQNTGESRVMLLPSLLLQRQYKV